MKRALFYVFYPSTFNVMIRAARCLRGDFEPVVLFDRFPPYDRDVAICRAENFAVVEEPNVDRFALVDAALTRLPRPLRILGSAPELARHYFVHRRRLARARELVRDIDLIVVPGDSVGYGTPELIRAGHDAGIPSLIVPYCFSSPSDIAVDVGRFPEFRADFGLNRLLGPSWVYQDLVRLPAPEALALQWLGLAPPQPWVFLSGAADRIAVDNEYTRDRYRTDGLPEEKLAMTGALADDEAALALREAPTRRAELYRQLGLPDRPMALFSLGDFSHFFATRNTSEFSSQDELVRFWMQTLASLEGWNVVVSLHPFFKYEDMRWIESANLKIARRPVEELIALSDFFVVSLSATTRTAIACGKPVIDHDVFRFRYRHYDHLPGVQVVEDRAAFENAVRSMPARLTELAGHQKKAAPYFGNLDGRAAERLRALANQLTR